MIAASFVNTSPWAEKWHCVHFSSSAEKKVCHSDSPAYPHIFSVYWKDPDAFIIVVFFPL